LLELPFGPCNSAFEGTIRYIHIGGYSGGISEAPFVIDALLE